MESNELPYRVKTLIDNIKEEQSFTPEKARRLLSNSDIQLDDLHAWADYDHPKADSYGRKLVYDGGFFELMVMSWVDGDMSAIHDHGYTQWGAVKLFGAVEHAIFKLENNNLITCERKQFVPNSVVSVNHDLIHQMGNNGQEPYLTLHLYGCHDREGDVTADARIYDLEEGQIQFAGGGVFFDLPETAMNRRVPAPSSDFPTWLRCNVELLKRLFRKNGSLRNGTCGSERESRVLAKLFSRDTWQRLESELGDMSKRTDRYDRILTQELAAAAHLQMVILEAGLVSSDINRDALRSLVAIGPGGLCRDEFRIRFDFPAFLLIFILCTFLCPC